MKTLIIALSLLPTISFASLYSCTGSGFTLQIVENPLEMKISGNGFNSVAKNVSLVSTFDTIVTGNTTNPPASVKLTIKDSGDSVSAGLQISSGAGIKEYSNLTCSME